MAKMTKGGLIEAITDHLGDGISKKQVKGVIEALATMDKRSGWASR